MTSFSKSARDLLIRPGDGAEPMTAFDAVSADSPMHVKDLSEAMAAVQKVYVSEVFIRHCVELATLTREHPEIELGASPRAGIALTQASRARAYIHGRDYTVPEDLFALAEDVILHRTRLTYEALAGGRTAEQVLKDILDKMV